MEFKYAEHIKLPKSFDKIKPLCDSSDLIYDKIENVQRFVEELAVKLAH